MTRAPRVRSPRSTRRLDDERREAEAALELDVPFIEHRLAHVRELSTVIAQMASQAARRPCALMVILARRVRHR
jgi:hypothetical protein